MPITADAIRVFGGRDWATTDSIGTLSPTGSGTMRRRNVKGKKTKSIGNIHALSKVGIFCIFFISRCLDKERKFRITCVHLNEHLRHLKQVLRMYNKYKW